MFTFENVAAWNDHKFVHTTVLKSINCITVKLCLNERINRRMFINLCILPHSTFRVDGKLKKNTHFAIIIFDYRTAFSMLFIVNWRRMEIIDIIHSKIWWDPIKFFSHSSNSLFCFVCHFIIFALIQKNASISFWS